MSTIDATRQAWPSPMPPEQFSLSIRRVGAKVVVTVSGELEPGGCLLIERALSDLIEGQVNVNVEVDLRAAHIEPSAWHRPPDRLR